MRTFSTFIPVTLLSLALFFSSCVKRKLYHSELLARKGAEGQVSALAKELHDRKRETAQLVKENGELNRQIGALQKEITDLHSELAKRTEAMGASTEKLLSEKRELEVKLNSTAKTLEAKEADLQKLQAASQARNQLLANDFGALDSAMAGLMNNGVILSITDDHIEMTVNDNLLFAPESTRMSPGASTFLSAFAQFLAERPGNKVQIHAHVDNLLPIRQRELTDSYAYSQARALAITRTLVSSYNVNAYMISPVAPGEYQPVSTNSTLEGRADNRRTVFYIYPD